MSVTTHRSYSVDCLKSPSALHDLESEWTALLTAMPEAPIFLTWEWITTWWRHFGDRADLWILTARDHTGKLVGIAPWMRTTEAAGPLRLRRICFLGSGMVYTAHLDVIAAVEDRESVCATFLDYLNSHRGEWDALDFSWLAPDAILATQLRTLYRHHHERSSICSFARLPDSWPSYERQVLSPNYRSKLRGYLRRLEREHPDQVTFQRVTTADGVLDVMNALVSLHRKRFTDTGRGSAFDHDRFVSFHREFAVRSLELGWLHLFTLCVDDRVIAVNYCFCYRGTVYGYQRAFDPEWGRHNVAKILQGHVIKSAIASGAHEIDMLHGVQGDKGAWTTDSRANTQILISNNWNGRAFLFGMHGFDEAKAIGKRILSPTLYRHIEQLSELRHR